MDLRLGLALGMGRQSTGDVVSESARPVAVGDYFHSEIDLYRVEEIVGDRVLIEDCRTGVLVDIELGIVETLARVSR